jgi:hypothetical protein
MGRVSHLLWLNFLFIVNEGKQKKFLQSPSGENSRRQNCSISLLLDIVQQNVCESFLKKKTIITNGLERLTPFTI